MMSFMSPDTRPVGVDLISVLSVCSRPHLPHFCRVSKLSHMRPLSGSSVLTTHMPSQWLVHPMTHEPSQWLIHPTTHAPSQWLFTSYWLRLTRSCGYCFCESHGGLCCFRASTLSETCPVFCSSSSLNPKVTSFSTSEFRTLRPGSLLRFSHPKLK